MSDGNLIAATAPDDRQRLLEARLARLEVEADAATRPTRAQRQAQRACQAAVEWLEMRTEGRWVFFVGEGGFVRNYVLLLVAAAAVQLVFGPGALTLERVLRVTAVTAIAAPAVALFLGEFIWRQNERNLARQLALAQDAPPASPGPDA
jgi:hypothetical protein